MFGGDPNYVFPSSNPVLLCYETANLESRMTFATVGEAREYLAYKREKDKDIPPGSFEARMIESSIAIYENGKLIDE